MESTSATQGQQICLGVTVNNFNNINGAQFSISYNSSLFTFASIGAMNLPGLTASSFGTGNAGSVTFSWTDPELNGHSVANGTQIFELCLNVTGNNTTTMVSFSNTPTSIEFINTSDQIVPVTHTSGTVTIGSGGGGGGGGGSNFTLNMESTTATQGQQVCLDVTVNNFTNINGMQFSIAYNSSIFSFASVTSFNLPGLGAASFGTGTPGVVTVSWTDQELDGHTVANGTRLFELCLNVTGNMTSMVSFSNTPTAIEVVNASDQTVPVTTNNGTVTISGGGGGGGSNFTLNMESTTATQGQQVCLDVTVNNFTNINGMQFSIAYNSSIFSFASVTSFNLPGLGAASFGTGTPGVITVSWTDVELDGHTAANGTRIFEVCFNVTGSTTTTVSFSNTPTAIEVVNTMDQTVPVTTNNGTVTIGGGGGGTNFTLIMENATAAQGQQICLGVTANNFTNINGMQFSIAYNSTALTIGPIQAFNLPGLSSASFGTPSPGVITVSWTDQELDGHTVANGTQLFEICFTQNNCNSSMVSFSSTPTAIEVVNTMDQTVPVTTMSGAVTADCGSSMFTLDIEDVTTACAGTQVCLDVTATNFVNINGAQFTITYNASNLSFVSVGAFNLPGLSAAANFGTATPGIITFSWTDPELNGTSLPATPAQRLFEVCFNVTVPTTTLAFANTPTAIEVVNTMDQNVMVATNMGMLSCGTTMGTAPTITNAAIQNLTCANAATGSIALTVSGTGPFTYAWMPNVGTGATVSTLAAGTYSVTVTDTSNGLTVTGEYVVTSPPALAVNVTNITNVACFGQPTGAITIAVSGGTPTYTIDWSGSLTDGLLTQTGLTPGSYSVTITDNNGCVRPQNNIQVTNQSSAPLTISAVVTNISTGNNGAINQTTTGGTPNYSYQWSGPNNFTSTAVDLSGLSTPGQYCVTVTDSRNCTTNQCWQVQDVLRIANFTINGACAGGSNGSITASISGGTSPYTYVWRNQAGVQIGGNSPMVSGLAPGNYTLQVTDNAGGQVSGNFTVNTLAAIMATPTITPANLGNNGSITLAVSGGSPGFTYLWNDGNTSANRTGLTPGQYCVTITDQATCTFTGCYTVPAAPLTLGPVDVDGESCAGEADGRLAVSIIGGVGPFTLVIQPGNDTYNSANGNFVITPLAPGVYTYTITDSQGAAVTDNRTISAAIPLVYSVGAVVNDIEDAGCSGSISLSISGGQGPYSVTWNIPVAGPQILQLCAGNYVPTIRDANGCEIVGDPIAITTLAQTQQTLTNATCEGDANGTVTVAVTGGQTPYTYAWRRQGNGTVLSTDATLSNVAPGVYIVTIMDATGATLVRNYTISTASNFTLAGSVASDYNGFDVSCADATDGRLEAVINAPGGTAGYNIQWLLDGDVVGQNAILSNAAAGNYTLVVTDNLGCAKETNLQLVAPSPLILSANVLNISCVSAIDGEIFVQANGGAPLPNYSYTWSTGEIGSTRRFLTVGSYTVTAEDGNGCEVTETYAITEPDPLQVTIETESATDDCNGTVRAVVVGGTAPYTYTWMNVPVPANNAIITDLCPGDYFVAVRDSRGCTASTVGGTVLDRRFPCLEERVVITPDGNGSNDEFIIFCIDELVDNHLEIYNRWGQLVFQTDNYNNDWEGTTPDGEDLPAGPYYFVLDYRGPDGAPIQFRGSLTIVRE